MILNQLKNAQASEGVRAHLDLHLDRLRRDLGLDLVFVARVAGGERRVEAMSAAPGIGTDLTVGQVCSAADCAVVCEVARRVPEAMAGQMGLGARVASDPAVLGVPLRLSTGTVFGVLGAVAPPGVRIETDLGPYAASMSVAIDLMHSHDTALQRVRGQLHEIIQDCAFYPVFQPVCDVEGGAVLYREGLTRLDAGVPATVPRLLAAAHGVGMGADLELAFARMILAADRDWPDQAPIAVNLSETTLVSDAFDRFLEDVAPGDIVELTEYEPIRDYGAMAEVVARMRAAGLSLAIDDTGAGYTSLRHILDLKPDILKIDSSLSARVDSDPEALALFRFLQTYCDETGTALVIEGIERADQLDALAEIGVRYVQGYFLGEPAPLSATGTEPA